MLSCVILCKCTCWLTIKVICGLCLEICYTLQFTLRSATWLVNSTGPKKAFFTADNPHQSIADSDTHIYS